MHVSFESFFYVTVNKLIRNKKTIICSQFDLNNIHVVMHITLNHISNVLSIKNLFNTCILKADFIVIRRTIT